MMNRRSFFRIAILALLWSTQGVPLVTVEKSNSFLSMNIVAHGVWEGGDIINATVTLENVTITEPLLIYNSTVAFKNVTIPDELQNTNDLIKIRNSTIYLYFPASPHLLTHFYYLPTVVWAENSTLVVDEPSRNLPPEQAVMEDYLGSFYAIINSHVIFNRSGWFGSTVPPEESGKIFSKNTVEFRNGAYGLLEGEDTTFIVNGPMDMGDPEIGNNNKLIARDVIIADFRTWGNVEIELYNATAVDTWYFPERVKVKAVNSVVSGTLLGEASMEVVNSTISGVISAYENTKLLIKSSEGDAYINIGGNSYGLIKDSNFSAVLTLTGKAYLKIEDATMEYGTMALLGESTAVAVNFTMKNLAGYSTVQVYDNSSMWITDANIENMYVFEGNVDINFSTILNFYYSVYINGPANINTSSTEQITGNYRTSNITMANSNVTKKIGHVFIEENGNATIRDSNFGPWGGVFVYGTAEIYDTFANNLLVYGENAAAKLNRSFVQDLFYSVHVNGNAKINGSDITGNAKIVSAVYDNSSVIERKHIGLLHVYGNANLTGTSLLLDAILIEGNSVANISDTEVRTIDIKDFSQVYLSNVTFYPDLRMPSPMPISKAVVARSTMPMFSIDIKFHIEIWGQSKVMAYRADGWVKVSDAANVTFNRISCLMAYGNSHVTLQETGPPYELGVDAPFAMLFENSSVRVINGIIGGVMMLVFDNATVIENYAWSQDIFYGKKNNPFGSGMVIRFSRVPWHNPVDGRFADEFGDQRPDIFSGLYYVHGWGVVRQYITIPYQPARKVVYQEVYVDGVLLDREQREPWLSEFVYVWNTTRWPNGEHMVTVIEYDDLGNYTIHSTIVNVYNPDTEGPLIGNLTQEPEANNVMPNQTVTVSVNVTEVTSGVKEVILSYSIDNGTTWTNVSMNRTDGNSYSGEIPGFSAGTYVQYKIIAYDNADNPAVNDNAGQYYVYTIVPEFPFVSLLPVFMLLTLIAFAWAKLTRRKHINSFPNK